MPCPDFQTFMLPILQALDDGAEHRLSAIRESAFKRLGLSESDISERVASGKKRACEDRANWACTYLKQAGLVQSVRRATYQIAPRGREVLTSRPERIDLELLYAFPEFARWMKGGDSDANAPATTGSPPATSLPSATPEEQIEAGYGALRRNVETELIQKILAASPKFFEDLVVELLVTMGYGGSRSDAGSALGRSGDGGLDGIIKEDRLGLDAIYIQAKRWDPSKHKVSRPDVQAFAGSLEGARARKGVFITTSGFSSEAHDYVARIEKKIVLIDGPHLATLLFDHGVGVRTKDTYEVKEVDEEYFLDD